MKFFLYILVCIVSGLFQTLVRPHIPEYLAFYDPLLIFIIYLGNKSSFLEGCIFSMVFGLFMDGLTSGGIGFYLASYTWFFFAVRGVGTYLRFGSSFIIILMVFIGILIQNGVFFLPEIIKGQDSLIGVSRLPFIKAQILWALFTSSVLFSFFSKLMTRYTEHTRSAFGTESDSQHPELIRE